MYLLSYLLSSYLLLYVGEAINSSSMCDGLANIKSGADVFSPKCQPMCQENFSLKWTQHLLHTFLFLPNDAMEHNVWQSFN